jgi:hypothetical protein
MAYLAMMIIDPVTMSTEAGRDSMKEIIDTSTNGVNMLKYVEDTVYKAYGADIYSYKEEIKSVLNLKIGERYSITDIIDPRFTISGDITVTVPVSDSDGSYKVLEKDTDYKVTLDTTNSTGEKLTVKFLKWDGYPAKISVPIKLNDISAGFFDSNDNFDNTNVGGVSATVTDVVYNSVDEKQEEQDERETITADSPKLYLSVLPVLPTAGGVGTGVFTACGVALMALGILQLRRKKKYEHKK